MEHQQLLAFVGSYLRHYGCLPTAAEAALGCGFRSPRPIARLLGELEASGVIRRDEQYGRLASIELTAMTPTLDEADQLWLAECAVVEHRACLLALRTGLLLAPDFETVEAIHAEGVLRATVLRTFEHIVVLLLDGGSSLTSDGEADLAKLRATMHEVEALMTDWSAYSVVQLVWTLSAHQWLSEIHPVELGYLGASCVASLRATENHLAVYWQRAAEPLRSRPGVGDLLDEVGGLLDRLRAGIGRHFPSRPERLTVDVASLLAS